MTPSTNRAALPRGFFSPGMYLLGRFFFPVKALIISLVLLLPLAYLMFNLYLVESGQIDFAHQERHGVRIMGVLQRTMHGLLEVRNATRAGLGGGLNTQPDYAAAWQRIDGGLSELEMAVAQHGDPLNLSAEVAKLKAAFAVTAASKQGVDDNGRTVFGPVTAATIELLQKLGDRSNLVLDPDLDSFYLMNGLVLTMPQALEDLGQLWGWSSYALQRGALTTDVERRYYVWDAVASTELKKAKEHFERAIRYNNGLQSKLDLSGIDRALSFRNQVKSVDELVASPLTPQQAYDEGRKAVADAMAVYQTGLAALDELLQARQARLYQVLWLSLVSVLVAVGGAVYLFYSFYLVMHQGLSQVGQHLGEMATGDLRHRPQPSWAKDETAALLAQMALTYGSMHELIRKVRHGARELHTASSEIAAASSDLSARTEASAAALEQQASAMEQIGSTVSHTAQTASQASEFSGQNALVADRAGETIGQVVATMQDINASSSRVSEIIGVIDGIAFQTNILALNAAVEAARAGDAGRGFAVVATEVRGLAQRSASAAKEIKALISTSVEKIDSGVQIVQSAGEIINDLVSNARKVNHLLTEIASSSKEQATGVDQVGHSIQDLDRSTQQNAALVEQTTSAASALKAQADKLQEEIRRFKVA